MLTLQERADMYHVSFPDYPKLVTTDRWIYGMWIIGNYYKRDVNFYGAYPHGYLKRVMSLFKDIEADNVIHLFSGAVRNIYGDRFDISPEFTPTYCGDVMEIDKIIKRRYKLAIADPPYEAKDFEKYRVKPFNKPKAIRKIAEIIEPGGFLVWLDLKLPIFSKQQWNMIGSIGLITGTNRRVRLVTIFQRVVNV